MPDYKNVILLINHVDLQGLMNTNKEDLRELAAQLYAVVVSTMSGNELRTAVQNLIKTTKDTHVCINSWFSNLANNILEMYIYLFIFKCRVLRLSMVPSWLWDTWWADT